MRLSNLLMSALAGTSLCAFAAAQSAPQHGGDLREEIRQIVREEVRAALRDAHGAMAAQGQANPHAVRVVQGIKAEPAKLQDVDVELERVGDLVKKLELKIAGEDGKPAKAHVLQLGDGAKAHGMVFQIGEGDEGKAGRLVLGHPEVAKAMKAAAGTMAFRITCDDGKCKVEKVGGDCCPGDCEGTFTVKTSCDDGKCTVKAVGGESCGVGQSCDMGGGACCEDDAKPKATKAKKAKKDKKAKKNKKAKAGEDCGSCAGVEACEGLVLKLDDITGSCEGTAKAECCEEGAAKASKCEAGKSECCEGEAKAKASCCEGEAKPAKAKSDCSGCIEGMPIQIELKDLQIQTDELKAVEVKAGKPAIKVMRLGTAKDPRVL